MRSKEFLITSLSDALWYQFQADGAYVGLLAHTFGKEEEVKSSSEIGKLSTGELDDRFSHIVMAIFRYCPCFRAFSPDNSIRFIPRIRSLRPPTKDRLVFVNFHSRVCQTLCAASFKFWVSSETPRPVVTPGRSFTLYAKAAIPRSLILA